MSTSPLLDSNHFLIPRIQIGKIQKDLLSFALLRNKGFVALLVDFISAILWRLGLDTVFGDFLENKNSSEQKNYTTFIDLPKGISERNMRIGIFPIMCHLPRGDKKNSLLNLIILYIINSKSFLNMSFFYILIGLKSCQSRILDNNTYTPFLKFGGYALHQSAPQPHMVYI